MILSMPNHVRSSVTRSQKHSRAGVSFKDTTSSTKYRGPLSVTFAIRLLRQNGGCLSTCALTQRECTLVPNARNSLLLSVNSTITSLFTLKRAISCVDCATTHVVTIRYWKNTFGHIRGRSNSPAQSEGWTLFEKTYRPTQRNALILVTPVRKVASQPRHLDNMRKFTNQRTDFLWSYV